LLSQLPLYRAERGGERERGKEEMKLKGRGIK